MSAQPKILLIAEDEEGLRELLALRLSGLATRVLTAPDGNAALEIIQKENVAAVISDLRMPGLSGIDLLSKIRSLGMDTPFVLITGFGDKEAVVKALRLGATDFLEKPFSMPTVMSVVRRALEEKSRESAISELYTIAASPDLGFESKIQFLMEMGCHRLGVEAAVLTKARDGVIEVAEAYGSGANVLRGKTFPIAPDGNWNSHFGFQTYIEAAVTAGQTPYGAVGFFARAARGKPFDEAEKTLVRFLAHWIGFEIDRKRAEESLESTLKELRDQKFALDQSSIVSITDTDGTITYVNEQFAHSSGYAREELIGANHRILRSGHHPREFWDEMYRTIAKGHVWKGEIENRTKSGQLVWHDTVIVPFLDTKGQPYQYVAVRRDVTERKNSERIIAEQQLQIISTAKMAALGEMAGGVAHEINNPLAIIHGKVDQLRSALAEGKLDRAEADQVLDRIDFMVRRIAKIVKGLKVFSRDGREDPMMPTPLATVVEDTLELCRERFRNHAIELKLPEIPQGLAIECRPAQLSQVLINLLGNAHDAIEKAEKRWVSLEVKDLGHQVEIAVTDSGHGIPADVRPKIFHPFFTTKEVGKGTGLGLSISKGIIEEHGGTLVHDAAHPNTRFVVRLPKRAAKAAPTPAAMPKAA